MILMLKKRRTAGAAVRQWTFKAEHRLPVCFLPAICLLDAHRLLGPHVTFFGPWSHGCVQGKHQYFKCHKPIKLPANRVAIAPATMHASIVTTSNIVIAIDLIAPMPRVWNKYNGNPAENKRINRSLVNLF